MTATDISQNLHAALEALPAEGVTLVAVSKFHPLEALQQAYACGQRIFGESRAAEMVAKAKQMPADTQWHFIGHLQTNKVRQIIPYVSLVHSVDSLKLLGLINTEASRINRRVDVLLQVHVAKETTKTGFLPDELLSELTPEVLERLTNVDITGLMGMASNTDDATRVRADFHAISLLFNRLRQGVMAGNPRFTTLSMGMSHDWPIAVEEGSNMVRIGTAIFGERHSTVR